MSTNYYTVERPLSVPEEGNDRFSDPTSSEVHAVNLGYRYDNRLIGGDRGDLYFSSFEVRDGETFLVSPTLATSLEINDQEEIDELAADILAYAYDALGVECVY